MRDKKMNKQELIGKYEYLNHNFFRRVDTSEVLRDLKQLDEPQKVTIPQFVADYIEWTKEEDYHLLGAMDTIMTSRKKNLYEWFYDDDNMELFARAWLDDYEVEKEKRYLVKFKATKHYFAKDGNGRIYFSLKYESAFTKIELEKANLDWVFDCEGTEVEEVEE